MELKDVKQAITSKTIVKYDNTNYKITAYILRLNGREWQHLVELKDLKAKSSVRIVKIKDVEV
jgi:hypothetical protein